MSSKHNFLIIISSAFLALAVSSCYYDEVLEPLEPAVTGEVSFSKDIVPLLNKSCNTSGCHNTGGIKPDLTAAKAYDALTIGNYISVSSPENSELYQWIRGKRGTPMPLSGPDATINAAVLAWIKQGAKNN